MKFLRFWPSFSIAKIAIAGDKEFTAEKTAAPCEEAECARNGLLAGSTVVIWR